MFLISQFVLAILLLLPSINSSQEGNTDSFNSIHEKLNHRLLYEVKVHGFLLWVSMGLFMPLGILTVRMSKEEKCRRRLKFLFYVHVTSQLFAVIVATAAAIMSIQNFNNSFNNYHQRIGVVVYAVIWLQALLGFLRPLRGERGRKAWFLGHWMVGSTVGVLGIISIYTGLHAYTHKTSRSTHLFTILFTIQISLIAFFYTLQDKWKYILQQEQQEDGYDGNMPARNKDLKQPTTAIDVQC